MTRVLTWNLERKVIGSNKAKAAVDYLFSQSPDVMAVSETHTNFPLEGGHVVWARPPFGRFAETERKILIWSRRPWRDIDDLGLPELPEGRFISAVTDTENGPIRFVGVCIPYHMADVIYCHKNRAPWEQHKRYLEMLPKILDRYSEPIIIVGDFNQRIPRIKNGNKVAAELLEKTFENFNIVSRDIPKGCDKQGLDHIALGQGIQPTKIWGWPKTLNGQVLTDHDGSGCDISLRVNYPND